MFLKCKNVNFGKSKNCKEIIKTNESYLKETEDQIKYNKKKSLYRIFAYNTFTTY